MIVRLACGHDADVDGTMGRLVVKHGAKTWCTTCKSWQTGAEPSDG